MYIFLKYIKNVCGFLRNRSQFCVFIVIFVLSASKLIRNGYYHPRIMKSVKICCPVLVVYKVALGQVFVPVLWSFPVSIIPQMFHTHLHLNTTALRRTCRAWELSSKAVHSADSIAPSHCSLQLLRKYAFFFLTVGGKNSEKNSEYKLTCYLLVKFMLVVGICSYHCCIHRNSVQEAIKIMHYVFLLCVAGSSRSLHLTTNSQCISAVEIWWCHIIR